MKIIVIAIWLFNGSPTTAMKFTGADAVKDCNRVSKFYQALNGPIEVNCTKIP